MDAALKYKGSVFLFILFVLAVTFIFRDAGEAMMQSWSQEEYSHGYLIPPLALLLLLNKISDGGIVPRSSWWGAALVLLGVVAAFLFQFAGIGHVLPQIYVFTLIGVMILFLGGKSLRPLAGPVILLLFAAPLPKFFYYAISSQMQFLSTTLGVTFLQWLGISVFQDGNIIDLGKYQLNVVEACSGVRYLFPLLSLSFLLSYMFKARLWKRAFVFLSTIPIAIFLNSLRIAIVGVTVELWGSAMAEGLLHDFEGVSVFVGGIAFLLLEIWILQRIGSPGELRFDSLRLPSLKSFPRPAVGLPTVLCGAFLLIALGLSAVLPMFLPQYLAPVALRQSFNSFPMQLGPWVGKRNFIDPKELTVLGTDDYLLADYARSGEPPVSLYVLYYPRQDSSSNQAVHTPTVCIPSGGWRVVDSVTLVIAIDDPASAQSRPLAVNRLLIAKGDSRQLVYYWYAQNDRSVTSPGATRLATFMSSLRTGHSNGALVRLVAPIARGETAAVAESRMTSFLEAGLPTLYGYMFEANPHHRSGS